MLGQRITIKRGSRDDEEKPFWISFADLMTALMVLFLVALCAALAQAQREVERATAAQKELEIAKAELERREKERDTRREGRLANIETCHGQLERIIAAYNGNGINGVRLDRARHVIDFGSRARFALSSNELSRDQAEALRTFVARFLPILRNHRGACRSWLKRIVVEGFTDKTGSYLLNLNLSLNRSQRVMCVLLAGQYDRLNRLGVVKTAAVLTTKDQQMIRELFLVGGYSSNSLKQTDEDSRRIELRIEFYQVDEPRLPATAGIGHAGNCRIGWP